MTRLRQILARNRGPEDPEPNGGPEPEPAPSPVRQPKHGGFAEVIRENLAIAIVVGLVVIFGIIALILFVTTRSSVEDAAEGSQPAAFIANCDTDNIRPSGYVQARQDTAANGVGIFFANGDASRAVIGTATAPADTTATQIGIDGAAANEVATFTHGPTERQLRADLNGDGELSEYRIHAVVIDGATVDFLANTTITGTNDLNVGTGGSVRARILAGVPLPVIAIPDGAPGHDPIPAGAALRVNPIDNCWNLTI